jgi:hypothetical protein
LKKEDRHTLNEAFPHAESMNDLSIARTKCVRRYAVVAIAVAAGAFLGFKFAGNLDSTVVGGLLGFLLGWRFAHFRYGSPEYARRYPSARLSVILSGGAWLIELLMLCRLVTPEWLQGGDVTRPVFFLMFPLTMFLWIFAGPLASSSARHAFKQISEGTRPGSDTAMARAGLNLSRMFTGLLLLYILCIGSMMGGCR